MNITIIGAGEEKEVADFPLQKWQKAIISFHFTLKQLVQGRVISEEIAVMLSMMHEDFMCSINEAAPGQFKLPSTEDADKFLSLLEKISERRDAERKKTVMQ